MEEARNVWGNLDKVCGPDGSRLAIKAAESVQIALDVLLMTWETGGPDTFELRFLHGGKAQLVWVKGLLRTDAVFWEDGTAVIALSSGPVCPGGRGVAAGEVAEAMAHAAQFIETGNFHGEGVPPVTPQWEETAMRLFKPE